MLRWRPKLRRCGVPRLPPRFSSLLLCCAGLGRVNAHDSGAVCFLLLFLRPRPFSRVPVPLSAGGGVVLLASGLVASGSWVFLHPTPSQTVVGWGAGTPSAIAESVCVLCGASPRSAGWCLSPKYSLDYIPPAGVFFFSMSKKQKKASGIITVRVSPDLHSWLRQHAAVEHLPLNRLLVRILKFYHAAAISADSYQNSPLFRKVQDELDAAIRAAVERSRQLP